SEPQIQRNGLGGENQILVQLPGVDDPGRVKDIIQSTARLELRESRGGPYPNEQAALAASNGLLPPGMGLLHGRDRGENQDAVYPVARIPVVSGTDIRDAREGTKSDTNQPIVNFYLTAAAGKKFAAFTGAHLKNGPDPANLAIVLDERVIS